MILSSFLSAEAGKHASLCEAMRSSRSVIYTPEALHFLEAPHIRLASNRTTFSGCAVCMAARKEPLLFLSRVLYKSIIRGLWSPRKRSCGCSSSSTPGWACCRHNKTHLCYRLALLVLHTDSHVHSPNCRRALSVSSVKRQLQLRRILLT